MKDEVKVKLALASGGSPLSRYRRTHHTSSKELADLATKAKPGLLILYHRANPGCDQARTDECRQAGSEEQPLKEMHQAYKGKVVAGHDLEIY